MKAAPSKALSLGFAIIVKFYFTFSLSFEGGFASC